MPQLINITYYGLRYNHHFGIETGLQANPTCLFQGPHISESTGYSLHFHDKISYREKFYIKVLLLYSGLVPETIHKYLYYIENLLDLK